MRALSAGTLGASLVALAVACTGYAADGHTVRALPLLLVGAATGGAYAFRDTPAHRARALFLAGGEDVVLVATAVVSPASAWYVGLPFALPALLIGSFDFAHWRTSAASPPQGELRRRSARVAGVAVALAGPAVAGGVTAARGHIGSAVVVAAFLASAALVARAFVDLLEQASDEGEEFRDRAAPTAMARTWDHVHGRIQSIAGLIDEAHGELVALHGPVAEIEQVAAARARARAAIERVYERYIEAEERRKSAEFDSSSRLSSAARRRWAAMRRWGDPANIPTWLPQWFRRLWVHVGGWLDVLRMANTSELQWVVLHATLWLRAALVGCAPAFGALVVAGVTPLAPQTGRVPNAVWIVVVVWAVITALLSPAIVRAAEDPAQSRIRLALLLIESPLSVAVMVAAPSFAVAAFSVGPTNWLQRPNWRIWKLITYGVAVTATLVGSLAARGTWGVGAIALETVIALAVIVLISSTYGMMLPLLLHALIVIPVRMTSAARSSSRNLRQQAVREAVAAATEALSVLDRVAELGYNGRLASLRTRLAERQTEAVPVDDSRFLQSESRALARVLSRSIFEVVPPVEAARGPADVDAPVELRARVPSVDPRLSGAVLARGYYTPFRLLVHQIALEAARYGEGRLRTRCDLQNGQIRLTMLNPIASSRVGGHGTGGALIDAYAHELPHGIARRGRRDPESLGLPAGAPIFAVEVTFSLAALSRVPAANAGAA